MADRNPAPYQGDQPTRREAPPTPERHGSAGNVGQPAEQVGGAAQGGGAGAGGGGGPEDYDSDPQGGGGAFPQQPKERAAPTTGGDSKVHGSH